MKIASFLSSLALFSASVASAATYDVYITGSTAGRSSVYTAIGNILSGETVTQSNSTLGSADQANFTNGTFGGDTYNIYCAWSGSAAGVQTLVNNSTVSFMSQTTGGTVVPTLTLVNTADIAFSDVFQSSTTFGSTTLQDVNTIVLPFRFYSSEGSPITNVTPQLFQVLAGLGTMPLAPWVGAASPANEGAGVVLAGRDNGSGTRITTMAETGVGAFAAVVQYQPSTFSPAGAAFQTLAGVTATASSPVLTHTALTTAAVAGQPVTGTGVPAGATILSVDSPTQITLSANMTTGGAPTNIRIDRTITGVTNIGNGGASSGGTVASYVSANTTLTVDGRSPCYVLSYLGLSDGSTASSAGAIACAYNGVVYNADAVRTGLYSLWGYLHMMNRDDINAGAALFKAELATALDTIPGSSGIQLSTMRVERAADGGNITPSAY
jgi:hypothetical protein